MRLLTLPYPERRDEIIRRVKRSHYSRRCPGVWTVAHAIERHGKIVAVTVYGPAPYPTVARAFCRDQAHTDRMAWQSRMAGAGVTSGELDTLIQYANTDLMERGYWWIHTLTDPFQQKIEGSVLRLVQRGYTGEVYHRNGFKYLGWSGSKKLMGFMIDGTPIHIRQGRVTLTRSNVRDHYPDARQIRALYGQPKQRWAYVLGNTPAEIAQRTLLMAYQPQRWEATRQPRLLSKLIRGILCTT